MQEGITFSAGAEFDFGTVVFSEEDIISFAKAYDPLDFHLSKEAAKAHFFKNIVASGPHPFHHFYKNVWVPRFGNTVLAGLAVDNWRFLKPIYAGEPVMCKVVITEFIHHPEHNSASIRWNFNFLNKKGELFQHLEMFVLHLVNY
ncbi:MAG TPA: MaoC/PaaZ C-terminal domain-containing protein [Bacteroidia bacterium]|nr:MaoC/PaaZ C-terminal domain-containing protein [Bacteroidia bacterium]